MKLMKKIIFFTILSLSYPSYIYNVDATYRSYVVGLFEKINQRLNIQNESINNFIVLGIIYLCRNDKLTIKDELVSIAGGLHFLSLFSQQ